MTKLLLSRSLSLLLILGSFSFISSNAQAAPAAHPGWDTVEHLLQKITGGKSDASAGPSSMIDYQEMSVRCLGKKEWDGLSSKQRSQFVSSLQGLVEKRYYPRWRKIFGKGKVTFKDESSQGGDLVVHTKLVLGKKEEILAWRIAPQSGSDKVVSLSVSNSDLLEKLKSRIQARREKVGFDALLAWMKGRSNDELGTTTVGSSPLAVVKGAPTSSNSLTRTLSN